MISVKSPIKGGDNERSRLSGIGSSGELVFKYVIRESTKSCVESVKHEIELCRVDVRKYIDNTRKFLLEQIGKQGTNN